MVNILIADDEKEIIRLLRLYLDVEEYQIYEAYDGITAINIAKTQPINLAIIDIMMPGKSGYEVIKEIRKNSYIPILVISAKVELSDRVLGIDLGADDYITKPFEPLEVAAKVRAALRRTGAMQCGNVSEPQSHNLRVGQLCLDLEQCVVMNGDVCYELTKAEFKVLELFMRNPGRVFTKEQIYEYGWDEDYVVDDNTIRVIISRLRDKIGNEAIKTIRGLGYRLERNG